MKNYNVGVMSWHEKFREYFIRGDGLLGLSKYGEQEITDFIKELLEFAYMFMYNSITVVRDEDNKKKRKAQARLLLLELLRFIEYNKNT